MNKVSNSVANIQLFFATTKKKQKKKRNEAERRLPQRQSQHATTAIVGRRKRGRYRRATDGWPHRADRCRGTCG